MPTATFPLDGEKVAAYTMLAVIVAHATVTLRTVAVGENGLAARMPPLPPPAAKVVRAVSLHNSRRLFELALFIL